MDLIEQNITDVEALEVRNSLFNKKISLELLRAEVYHLLRLCVKDIEVCDFIEGYLVVHKKTKKKSKRQQYMEEVLDKIEKGAVDFDNTKIDINSRDMRSIQRHLGVSPNLEDTNYSKNHLEWGRVQHLFDKVREGELSKEDLVGEIRKVFGYEVSITAIKYKLFEMNL